MGNGKGEAGEPVGGCFEDMTVLEDGEQSQKPRKAASL